MSTARGLLHATALISAARVVGIVCAVARAKAIALLLGPEGIGLLGLLRGGEQLGSKLFSLGLQEVGVRQIVLAREDPERFSRLRAAVLAANIGLGILAMATFWIFRETIAVWMFGAAEYTFAVGLIGVAVFASLIGNSQTIVLRAMRRRRDLALIIALSALIGSVISVLLVWQEGMAGLVVVVMAIPVTTMLVAAPFLRRLPSPASKGLSVGAILAECRVLFSMGSVMLLAGMAPILAQMAVRALIVQHMGFVSAGYFQAAWAITYQYMTTLIMSAMMDYFPRLVSALGDSEQEHALINTQGELCTLLCGPMILFLIGCAPWILTLFYSELFTEAAPILQCICLGSLARLLQLPISAQMQAHANVWGHAIGQMLHNGAWLLFVWSFLEVLGLEATGIGFALASGLYFLCLTLYVGKKYGFRWQPRVIIVFLVFVFSGLLLMELTFYDQVLGALASLALAAVYGFVGLRRIVSLVGPEGRLFGRVARIYARIGWPAP